MSFLARPMLCYIVQYTHMMLLLKTIFKSDVTNHEIWNNEEFRGRYATYTYTEAQLTLISFSGHNFLRTYL